MQAIGRDRAPPPPSKGGFQTPYTVKVQEGCGTEAVTGGGKEGQDRGEARKAEAEQRVKATDESAEQRVETRPVPEMKLTELKVVAMENQRIRGQGPE